MAYWNQYKVKAPNIRPKDESFPQFNEDQPSDKTFNDVANDWRRGAGESAEGKPGYVPGGGRAKREK
jgi:hypothetical protein